jgi:tyrosine-protein kinase Tec
MWEVFTCGKMPYGRLKNTEVVERVQRGIILEKPKACAKEIYDVSFNFNQDYFIKDIKFK